MPLDMLADGVYVKAHLLFVSIHTFGLKTPPAPLSLHEMIPAIEEDRFEVSVTAAVTVIELLGVNVVEFGVTVTVVESGVLETDVPLLSVNIILLLSAIAGRTVKPPKSDKLNMQNMIKNEIFPVLKNMKLLCVTVSVLMFLYFKIG